MTTNASTGTQIATDEHLVNLWLAGRPDTTRRAYRADADWFLGVRSGDLRGTSVVDVLTTAQSVTGASATRARRIAAIKSLPSKRTSLYSEIPRP